ncbi:MAG: small multidrug resistance pump [Alpinimonas sp.]|jgi:small multidrug resistance pump
MIYLFLVGAIILEVVGTVALKLSEGFSKFIPSAVVVVGYLGSFLLLGIGLNKGLSVSVAYAIWAGAGTALVAIAGIVLFKEQISTIGFVGIGLIIAGVVMLELGSGAAH